MVAFGVLLVAGLLLIAFTYDALDNSLVVLVSYLISAGISLGLVTQFYPQYGKWYLIPVVLGLISNGVTRMLEIETLGKIVLPIFHAMAGLIIFFQPILVVREEQAPASFLWVTVGGALIGLGGIAFAFIKADSQLLFFSSDVVFTILAPLLLLTSLAFTRVS